MNMRLLLSAFSLAVINIPASAAPEPAMRDFGVRDWQDPKSMTVLDGVVYAATGDVIYRIDPNGRYKEIPAPAALRPDSITSLNGKLYVMSENSLVEVNPNGSTRVVDDDYPFGGFISANAGKLYVINQNSLYATDTAGHYKEIPGDWYTIRGMSAANGKLYVGSRDDILEVDPSGRVRPLAHVPNLSGLAAEDGVVYAVGRLGTRPPFEYVLWGISTSGMMRQIPVPPAWRKSLGPPMTVLNGRIYFAFRVGFDKHLYSFAAR